MPGKPERRATSIAQRRMAGMVAHASPSEIAKAGPAVKQMAKSMTTEQAREMARGKEKHLPEHAKKKHDGRQAKKRGE